MKRWITALFEFFVRLFKKRQNKKLGDDSKDPPLETHVLDEDIEGIEYIEELDVPTAEFDASDFLEEVETAPRFDTIPDRLRYFGLDITQWHKGIDWGLLAKNQEFVYIKATEGVGWKDTMAEAHANNAIRVRIPFGYQHHATPASKSGVNVGDSVEEARYFVQMVRSLPEADLPPVLVLDSNRDLSPTEMVEWVDTFMIYVKDRLRRTPIIQMATEWGDSVLPGYHDLGKWPLWVIHYTSAPAPNLPTGWDNWVVWQYAGKGEVLGYRGYLSQSYAKSALFHQ